MVAIKMIDITRSRARNLERCYAQDDYLKHGAIVECNGLSKWKVDYLIQVYENSRSSYPLGS